MSLAEGPFTWGDDFQWADQEADAYLVRVGETVHRVRSATHALHLAMSAPTATVTPLRLCEPPSTVAADEQPPGGSSAVHPDL